MLPIKTKFNNRLNNSNCPESRLVHSVLLRISNYVQFFLDFNDITLRVYKVWISVFVKSEFRKIRSELNMEKDTLYFVSQARYYYCVPIGRYDAIHNARIIL